MTMPEDFNFWQDYALEGSPEAAYYSAAPFGTGMSAASPFGGGAAPAAQQYWSGQYGNVMNQYVGELGRSMRAGEAPTMTFTDYLQQYPWTQRYSAMSPAMRPGGRTSRYAPAARRYY
ncbi:hypothetical protein CMI37_05585 [Candidatus Pacearchaeota archaeon]|nr:hypothetical protein [Candidatus Pacearchaeota archaeon]